MGVGSDADSFENTVETIEDVSTLGASWVVRKSLPKKWVQQTRNNDKKRWKRAFKKSRFARTLAVPFVGLDKASKAARKGLSFADQLLDDLESGAWKPYAAVGGLGVLGLWLLSK